jgi:serine/threonine protein kinase
VGGTDIVSDSAATRHANGPPVASGEEDLSGKTLADKYLLARRVGGGGMGAVYEAEHTGIGKRVAIKVLSREFAGNAEYVARFVGEARAASTIDHENVIDITDVGTSASGRAFIVMELLEGEPLTDTIQRDSPLPWSRAKPIALQICRALHAAHEAGVVHRDIKPDNCFRSRRGANHDFIRVLDFGIAKIFGDERRPAEAITKTGTIFGTPEYMSPEQARGDTVDHRTDIYSLGIVLYELLTGTVPFGGNTVISILTKQAMDPPQPPSLRKPSAGIWPALDALVLTALEKSADARHQTMRELAEAIIAMPDATPAQASVADRSTAGHSLVGAETRWRTIALALGLLCVGLAVGLVIAVVK